MRLFIPLVLFVVLTAQSCSSSRKTVQLDPFTISSANSGYRASATMDWDITHTDIALTFNLTEKTAKGTAKIDMHPYFYPSDKIVLDAKSMKIEKVQSDGKNLKSNYQNDSLTIYLDRKYHHTESMKIEITYTAMPYGSPTGGSKAIRDDRGLYFINTDNSNPYKPVQIWTQGETEANSHWVPTFDKPNERFTTQIQMTIPDSFKTLSNGRFAGSITEDAGTRTDTWVMDKDIQPYVMMMAIGKYEVVADKQWKGKDVNYYVEPAFAPYALDMFRNTPEMIEFFSNVTGVPYPWDKYSQVVVRDYVSGAMENTSATVFGEFINQTSREIKDKDYEDVVSHELFHQWFGDYVTAESWSNLTLNESFATYGEQLWRRYKYGKAAEQKQAYEDGEAYLGQANKNDEPLVRFHYNEREDMFDRISYQKGAVTLRYLHGLMGDSAFYKAMNIYLAGNALQPGEAHQWRMAVEKATGKDWNWFFNQWYFRGGHPVLDVKYEFDDTKKQVKITLSQKQEKLYQLPLKINVVTGDNTFSDMIDMDTRTMAVTYPYYNGIRPAVFTDAEHWLVGELTDNKTPQHWLTYYKAAGSDDFIAKAKALKATGSNLTTKELQDLYKLALHDDLEYIRVYALNYLQAEKNKAVQNVFKENVQFLALQDVSGHVKAAAHHVLGTWKITEPKQDMYVALSDESYEVAAAALKRINTINKDTAYTIAKQMMRPESQGMLSEQIWDVIGTKANTADTALIQDYKYRVSGTKRISFAASLAKYMKNSGSDEAYKIALNTVEYLVLSESIGSYRGAITGYLFETAYYYKDEVSDNNNKTAVAKASDRLGQLRKVILKIEEKETDQENLANYRLYQKDLFGK